MPPTKRVALDAGLDVIQPAKVRAAATVQDIESIAPDCIVVVAYGQIIPQSILDIPPKGIINVHGSLLPTLRGAAPIQWAIVNGERLTGVTTMLMDAGLDTGPILMKREMEILEGDTAQTLSERMAPIGASLLLETLDEWSKDRIVPIAQNDEDATKAPIIKLQHARVDWTSSAAAIANQIRGFNPWPVAHTVWKGQRLRLWHGTPLLPPLPDLEEAAPLGSEPIAGTIVATKGPNVTVQCGTGQMQLNEVQAEGKRRMSAGDFARGQRIEPGDRLGDESGAS